MINLSLDKKSPVPFYRQIVDLVLLGISSGTISPGDKLPTIREAAVNLEVNPNTIVKAYNQLRMMGVLDTQQGSGAFVRKHADHQSKAEKMQVLDTLCRDFIARAQMFDISVKELMAHMKKIRVKN